MAYVAASVTLDARLEDDGVGAVVDVDDDARRRDAPRDSARATKAMRARGAL